jgi:dTDP-4-dehydrorhamnose reductase
MKTLNNMMKLDIDHKPIGIYNLGSNQGMSKADFDFEFAEILGLSVNTMSRICASEAKFLRTYRPKDMRMDCSRFENLFNIKLPKLTEEIRISANEYYEKT